MSDPAGSVSDECRQLLAHSWVLKDEHKVAELSRYSPADQATIARRFAHLCLPWPAAIEGLEPLGAYPARPPPLLVAGGDPTPPIEVPAPSETAPDPAEHAGRPAAAEQVNTAPQPSDRRLVRLRLDEIVLHPALQVRPIDEAVAREYAEHLDDLPPSEAMVIDGRAHLTDGRHRHRAHELGRAADMPAWVSDGTMEEARLFVAGCDARVGLRRTRAAKRAAVLMVLETASGAGWSEREIAKHCAVSHTFVARVRAEIAGTEVGGGNVATYPQVHGDAGEADSGTADRGEERASIAADNGQTGTAGDIFLPEVELTSSASGEPASPRIDAGESPSGDVGDPPAAEHQSPAAAIIAFISRTLADCDEPEKYEALAEVAAWITAGTSAVLPGERDGYPVEDDDDIRRFLDGV